LLVNGMVPGVLDDHRALFLSEVGQAAFATRGHGAVCPAAGERRAGRDDDAAGARGAISRPRA
jgi:hypothetical protein